MGTPVSALDLDAALRRSRADDAIHNAELEGFTVSSQAESDVAEWIEGRFDAEELVARTRARYGLS